MQLPGSQQQLAHKQQLAERQLLAPHKDVDGCQGSLQICRPVGNS